MASTISSKPTSAEPITVLKEDVKPSGVVPNIPVPTDSVKIEKIEGGSLLVPILLLGGIILTGYLYRK